MADKMDRYRIETFSGKLVGYAHTVTEARARAARVIDNPHSGQLGLTVKSVEKSRLRPRSHDFWYVGTVGQWLDIWDHPTRGTCVDTGFAWFTADGTWLLRENGTLGRSVVIEGGKPMWRH